MNEYKIAVIPGDGIGKEVVREACKVLDSVAIKNNFKLNYESFDWGSDFYFKNKKMMPEDGLEILGNFDTIFLGAVGDPKIQDHITLNGLLLPIRRRFDQFGGGAGPGAPRGASLSGGDEWSFLEFEAASVNSVGC